MCLVGLSPVFPKSKINPFPVYTTMAVSKSTITLITGANQGIGFGIARALSSPPHNHHVLLGARDASKGAEAVAALTKDGQSVELVVIDVTSDESISAAASTISSKYGRLDVLINNAGIALDVRKKGESTRKLFEETFACNTFGATVVTEIFTPLLDKSSDPRVIFMSSSLGSLDKMFYDKERKAAWLTYRTSKTALNMIMKTFALEHENWKVNGCCPGHIGTYLNANEGRGTIEEGSINAVRLATGDGKETGTFSNKEGTVPW